MVPKREFRAAWIQCVNGQFQNIGTEKMQKTLSYQLDELQKDGANAIIFQVRPACDALYPSSIEPWSHFLTGVQGKAPYPYWDPLQWMIDQCHKRGMELHAWINPYRAKSKLAYALAPNHICNQHPERVFEYDGLQVLHPALQENRDYICTIVEDILKRYDVDGLHIDDYFYPYPVPGVAIPDDGQFRANPQGYANKNDWRRHQVDLLIEQLNTTIHRVKPWVKFGVSPFGIYRNIKNDPRGSKTNGLQNYDELYADVLLWIEKGWVDYIVPQLYWEMGHKAADYTELIRWWSDHASARPLFIGEDVERTVKNADPSNPGSHQLPAKMRLHQENPGVQGTVLWYAKAAVDNIGNYGTNLRNVYWRYPALQPLMPHLDHKAPGKVRKLKVFTINNRQVLMWTAPKFKSWDDEATKYVVYCFKKGEDTDISNPSHIVAITDNCFYELPVDLEQGRYVYIVTALDRLQNESKTAKKKIKLY
jgi:uncharacterized lipoprotein YddW (UPF0748 family)